MKDVVITLTRANLYGFLSLVFSKPPSETLTESLSNGPLRAVLAEHGRVPMDVLLTLSQDVAQLRDELAVAFTRLIIGPGTGYIPPYSSMYLDRPVGEKRGRPLLWGASTQMATRIYHEAGVEPPPGQVPDHIGVELEFMRYLCAREAEAQTQNNEEDIERCRRWQTTFLHEHLLKWGPSWARDVEVSPSHPFYQTMARLLRAFLELETEMLGNLHSHSHGQIRSEPCASLSSPSSY